MCRYKYQAATLASLSSVKEHCRVLHFVPGARVFLSKLFVEDENFALKV